MISAKGLSIFSLLVVRPLKIEMIVKEKRK